MVVGSSVIISVVVGNVVGSGVVVGAVVVVVVAVVVVVVVAAVVVVVVVVFGVGRSRPTICFPPIVNNLSLGLTTGLLSRPCPKSASPSEFTSGLPWSSVWRRSSRQASRHCSQSEFALKLTCKCSLASQTSCQFHKSILPKRARTHQATSLNSRRKDLAGLLHSPQNTPQTGFNNCNNY